MYIGPRDLLRRIFAYFRVHKYIRYLMARTGFPEIALRTVSCLADGPVACRHTTPPYIRVLLQAMRHTG